MKPAFSSDEAIRLIEDALGETPRQAERTSEGMESRNFRVALDSRIVLLRIGSTIRAFEKDRWAAVNVAKRVPVPQVLAIGTCNSHAYCVSEWVDCGDLESLPPSRVAQLNDAVEAAWREIGRCDVTGIAGFGDFDHGEVAPTQR